MKRFSMIVVVVWIASAILGAILGNFCGQNAVTAFANLRTVLVSGLLALCAVALTLRVTWMPRIKEAYETEEHMENVEELRERGVPAKYYGGFDRLLAAFSYLSGLLILSAVLQVTLGSYPVPWKVGVCMGSAGGALFVVLSLLWRAHRIERFWVKKLEKDQEERRHPRTPPQTPKAIPH